MFATCTEAVLVYTNGYWQIHESVIPVSAGNFAVISLEDNLTALVCGGLKSNNVVVNTCFYYDSTHDKWTLAPKMNVARGGHGMAWYAGMGKFLIK